MRLGRQREQLSENCLALWKVSLASAAIPSPVAAASVNSHRSFVRDPSIAQRGPVQGFAKASKLTRSKLGPYWLSVPQRIR
jgi:hypothetical protein